DPLDRVDPARQLAHGDVPDPGDEPRFDDQRRAGAGAAHQRIAGSPFGVIERARRMRALLHLALEHPRLAGAADPVLAAVRHDDRLAQGRVEDALVRPGIEFAAARHYRDPESHRLSVPAPYHCPGRPGPTLSPDEEILPATGAASPAAPPSPAGHRLRRRRRPAGGEPG